MHNSSLTHLSLSQVSFSLSLIQTCAFGNLLPSPSPPHLSSPSAPSPFPSDVCSWAVRPRTLAALSARVVRCAFCCAFWCLVLCVVYSAGNCCLCVLRVTACDCFLLCRVFCVVWCGVVCYCVVWCGVVCCVLRHVIGVWSLLCVPNASNIRYVCMHICIYICICAL